MISEAMPKNGRARMYTSGWPKNQNRCCQRMAPPFSGANTSAPYWRSMKAIARAAASTGKHRITRMLVTKIVHVKIGIRNMVMPGARMVKIVVMKLTAPRMVPRPPMARPRYQRSAPTSGE